MVKSSIKIIPGILEKDFNKIKNKVNLVSHFVDWIQIDLSDGKFVPNGSFSDINKFKALLKTHSHKNFELHMMVNNPFEKIGECVSAGFKRIIIHIESLKTRNSKFEIRNKLQSLNLKFKTIELGLAVDTPTPVEAIKPYLKFIDCVLIMTVKAGFSGQKFMHSQLEKLRKLRKWDKDLPIEVDGGINEQTGKLAVYAGAARLAATNYIFNSKDIKKAIWRLENLGN